MLSIFGILSKDKLEEIQRRRIKKAIFYQKRRKLKWLQKEAKALEEEKNNPKGKGIIQKKTSSSTNC